MSNRQVGTFRSSRARGEVGATWSANPRMTPTGSLSGSQRVR